jgi:hypothetical protein
MEWDEVTDDKMIQLIEQRFSAVSPKKSFLYHDFMINQYYQKIMKSRRKTLVPTGIAATTIAQIERLVNCIKSLKDAEKTAPDPVYPRSLLSDPVPVKNSLILAAGYFSVIIEALLYQHLLEDVFTGFCGNLTGLLPEVPEGAGIDKILQYFETVYDFQKYKTGVRESLFRVDCVAEVRWIEAVVYPR